MPKFDSPKDVVTNIQPEMLNKGTVDEFHSLNPPTYLATYSLFPYSREVTPELSPRRSNDRIITAKRNELISETITNGQMVAHTSYITSSSILIEGYGNIPVTNGDFNVLPRKVQVSRNG